MVILAYDLGTSLLKTTIVDLHGKILASASQTYPTYIDGVCAEQKAEDWWACVCQTTHRLMNEHPEYRSQIAAIGVSGHMSGCLAVNSDGKPLRPAIIHADSRAAAQTARIVQSIGRGSLYQKTGCVLDPKASLCKILWMKDNEPALYKKTARFLQSKDYLTACLTGHFDVTDYSDASHAMLLDIHKKRYLEDELHTLGLDTEKLADVHKGTDVVGSVTPEAARALGITQGIPVVAGGGDGACASVGAGICSAGDTYCSLGTTAWIAYESPDPVIDRDARIFDIMSLDGGCYGVFGTMQTAGKAVEWARALFGLQSAKTLDQFAAQAPVGSDGLVFLPYLDGERSPVFDSNARGIFFGIHTQHEMKHFLRAVLEGVAYGLRSILQVHRERADIPRMRIIGGGAKSPLWQQIIADVCDIELETLCVGNDSLTSLGAAFAAGTGIGIYHDLNEAIRCLETRTILQPNREHAERYQSGFETYIELYPHVKTLFC